MRICIISFFYKPAGGGIPRYVDNLAKGFSNLGHNVDILTVSYDGTDHIEEKDNIMVYMLDCMNIFEQTEQECREKSKEFLRFLRDYIGRKAPEIFVAQNMHAAVSSINHTLVLNMIALEEEIPLILTIHSYPNDPYSDLKISFAKNLFWDRIITVSSAVAEFFNSKGIDVEKIKVLYPGVDTQEFKPLSNKKWLRSHVDGLEEKDIVVLHASRTDSATIIEEKGIKILLKAFSSITDQHKNIKLLIASAPVPEPFKKNKEKTIEKIENLIKLYNLGNKVKIATFYPEDMPNVYNGADIFVMASQLETFGLVYAEAMACGIPVIGTSVGGIPEVIVNGKCGYIVPPDNPVELAKYLSLLIADPQKRKNFGKFGRKIVLSRFDNSKICEKRLGNYKSLIYHKNAKKTLSFFKILAKE